MPQFKVYQQLPPIDRGDGHTARLDLLGVIEAHNARLALNEARKMAVFLRAPRRSLARWPIVEEIGVAREDSEPWHSGE